MMRIPPRPPSVFLIFKFEAVNKLILSVFFIFYGSSLIWGQCFPDRHSTNWFDGWVSCEPFPSPHPDQGLSHWIMYDLNQVYKLTTTHIWNTNDPAHLEWGLRDIQLHHSKDGQAWDDAGVFTLEQGTGSSLYEGFEGPDLQGIQARYVLLTAIDNYGGSCYGLSEVRFSAEDATVTDVSNEDIEGESCLQVQLYPNPFDEQSRVLIQTQCHGDITFTVRDVLGRVIKDGRFDNNSAIQSFDISGVGLPTGSYVVTVEQGGARSQHHLLKVD